MWLRKAIVAIYNGITMSLSKIKFTMLCSFLLSTAGCFEEGGPQKSGGQLPLASTVLPENQPEDRVLPGIQGAQHEKFGLIAESDADEDLKKNGYRLACTDLDILSTNSVKATIRVLREHADIFWTASLVDDGEDYYFSNDIIPPEAFKNSLTCVSADEFNGL